MTINDLDERAKTAIKSLKLTDSMEVISQIKTRDLTHVSNKVFHNNEIKNCLNKIYVTT